LAFSVCQFKIITIITVKTWNIVMNQRLKSLAFSLLLSFVVILPCNADDTIENALARLEAAITQQDSKKLDQELNLNAFLERAVEPVSGISSKSISAFKSGFMRSSKNFSERLIAGFGASRVTLLKSNATTSGFQALYRFDLEEAGYNYLEFIFEKNASDQFEIVDWYSHTTSEFGSETIRQLLVFALPNDGVIKKFLKIVKGDEKDAKRFIKALGEFGKNRNPQLIVDAFEAGGESIRSNPSIAIFYLLAAGKLNDEPTYKRALKTFAKYHANNPKYALVLVDHYFYLEEYNKAVNALNRFERVIGVADPALYFLRANAYFQAKDYQKALLQTARAIQINPKFEDSYWTQVNVYIATNNFEKVVSVFEILSNDFGYEFTRDLFEAEEFYQDFIKSSAYQNWLS
jgi:tetratricopeptide (TPR) repeat protein